MNCPWIRNSSVVRWSRTKDVISVALCIVLATALISNCSNDVESPNNIPPKIVFITASADTVFAAETCRLSVSASDDNGDGLAYSWEATAGTFPQGSSTSEVLWKAPNSSGQCTARVHVTDGRETVSDSLTMTVVERTLSIDPDSLDFGALLTTRSFRITYTGTSLLEWDISDNPAWATVDPMSGETASETDTITVTVDRLGLFPGAYEGVVNVTSNGGDDSVIVFMSVPSAPVLSVHPLSLDFGESETSLGFDISNSGTGVLTWSVTDDQDWIVVAPVSGSTTVETDMVTVNVNRAGMSLGSHSGTISVASNGGEATINVSMVVGEAILSVDPAWLYFEDPTTEKTFEITNLGGGTLTWTAGGNQSWMNVNPTVGTTTAETDEVTVTVSRAGLSPGVHTGAVDVESNGGNASVLVAVEVLPLPTATWYFAWASTGLRTFTYVEDGVYSSAHVALGTFAMALYTSPPNAQPSAGFVVEDASVIATGVTVEPASVQVNYGGMDMGYAPVLTGPPENPVFLYRAFLTVTEYVPPSGALTPGSISGYLSGYLGTTELPPATSQPIKILSAAFQDIPVYGF